MSFRARRSWDHGEVLSPEDLFGVPGPTLNAGFLRTIEHVSGLGFLLEHLQSKQSLEFNDRQMLQRRIKEAVRWRFSSSGSQLLFRTMADRVERTLPLNFPWRIDLASFRDELDELILEWGVGGGGIRAKASGGPSS
jgi:hypothetical protein